LKRKLLAGLLSSLLLVCVAPAAGPASAAAATDLRVMSWNMCGSQRASWGCAAYGRPQDKIGVVERNVVDQGVRAVLLQEICENDLTALVTRLGAGWNRTFQPYQWSQAGVKANNKCGEEAGRADRIGTAIVTASALTSARSYPTTQPWTGQNRPFHCATATTWNVRLCAVHLSPKGSNPDEPTWEYADDQLAEIKAVAAAFPKVVLGGDFNVEPPHFPGNARAWLWPSGFYSTGPGVPGYAECDRGLDRDTHDGGYRLDYLFGTATTLGCSVTDTAYSDHHVVVQHIAVT
jgi:hypothetical protein